MLSDAAPAGPPKPEDGGREAAGEQCAEQHAGTAGDRAGRAARRERLLGARWRDGSTATRRSVGASEPKPACMHLPVHA